MRGAKSRKVVPAASVPNGQLEPQQIVAPDGVNRRLAAPSLTAHFTNNTLATGRDCQGQLLAQIKIATHTFVIGAIKSKKRFGVSQINGVFELAAFARARRVEMRQVHGQGLHARKFSFQAGRFLHAEIFLLAVFRPRIEFFSIHESGRKGSTAPSLPLLPANVPERAVTHQPFLLFVPKTKSEGFQAGDQSDWLHTLKERLGVVTLLEMIVRDARAQMMNVMKAD